MAVYTCALCAEGHDSVQDAAVALELALLKAVQVSRGEGRLQPWADEPVPKCSVFETLLLTSQVRSTGVGTGYG